MREHFKDALLIRQAVIDGAPWNAIDPAYALAHLEDLNDLPPGWRDFVERMQQTAARIEGSTTATQAAGATADLGVSCGMCHQRRGGPTASSEPAPIAGTTLESRMERHVWATERLWEGLYVPSSDAWNAGAMALGVDPFPVEVTKGGGVHARSAAEDFSKLAATASSKKTVSERAALYAELLVTCGGCHRAMHRGE
jgi:cytochrome c553